MLGHTFAHSLATNGERIFWALAAQLGLIVVGADCDKTFGGPLFDQGLVEVLGSLLLLTLSKDKAR